MLYQRKKNGKDVGDPAELPKELQGLADESLSDLSWADDTAGFKGVSFHPVADVPKPNPPRTLNKRAFMLLQTAAERIAIREAAAKDPAIQDYVDVLYATNEINLEAPFTAEALDAFEQAGLIAAGRAATILAGQAPA